MTILPIRQQCLYKFFGITNYTLKMVSVNFAQCYTVKKKEEKVSSVTRGYPTALPLTTK